MDSSSKRKRGDYNPDTGKYFIAYDKSILGGEFWSTLEVLEKTRERIRVQQAKLRRDPLFMEKHRAYLHRPDVRARKNANRSSGIGRGRGKRKDATTPQAAKKRNLEWKKRKRREDPVFKLKYITRSLISRATQYDKSYRPKHFVDVIGCGYDELRDYLESKFQPGMSWANHGSFGWHIDHIVPLAVAKTKEDALLLSHYTNLQPLWWRDNLTKSGKVR